MMSMDVPMIRVKQPYAGLVALSDPREEAPHFATAAVVSGTVPESAVGKTVAILALPFPDLFAEDNCCEAPEPWSKRRDKAFHRLRELGLYVYPPHKEPKRHDRLLSVGNAVVAIATLTGLMGQEQTSNMARRLYSPRLAPSVAADLAQTFFSRVLVALFANVVALPRPYGTKLVERYTLPPSIERKLAAPGLPLFGLETTG